MFPHFIRPRRAALGLVFAAALSGCDLPPQPTTAEDPPEPGVRTSTRAGPADAAPGTCWGKTASPAVIETVTEQVEIEPARFDDAGNVTVPPVLRTETRQEIVTPRVENWFETPCEEVLTPEFVATLQRALAARGFYQGAADGILTDATRAAVGAYQRAEAGLDSGVLSLDAARALGLVAVPRRP
jgi:hypothetical protein